MWKVVSLCWSHGLYTGILYVYNRAMHDYTTPLEQLLTQLHHAVSTGKQLTYQQVYTTINLLTTVKLKKVHDVINFSSYIQV